jgi:FtsP/CotA-like multicopper oxidase with cupredoxin domain
MANKITPRKFTRRDFLKLTGQGALLGLLGSTVRSYANAAAGPRERRSYSPVARPLAYDPVQYHRRFVATDNMDDVILPGRLVTPLADPNDPASYVPLYVFGFREVLDPDGVIPQTDPGSLLDVAPTTNPPLTSSLPLAATIDDLDVYKGRVQMPSPIIAVTEGDELFLTLTNLGFVGRPDLDDSHTIHWHGFPNATAIFDGVPEVSIAVLPARNFPYYYKAPSRPGTYMYHCHFEDSEHVQMGMDGIVLIRPALNAKWAYSDVSTAFDREWTLLLNEIDTRPHDGLLAVQEFVWSDFKPTYWIINGRSYPHTLLPNNDPLLPSQTISSLIQIKENETGLLRLANLGYEQQAMHLTGIPMKVVGEDATFLRGPNLEDLSYMTNTVYIGPGEARDVLFTAPDFDDGLLSGAVVYSDDTGSYNRYLLKSRNLQHLINPGLSGLGGMATEVRVYPTATPLLGPQTEPNQTYL